MNLNNDRLNSLLSSLDDEEEESTITIEEEKEKPQINKLDSILSSLDEEEKPTLDLQETQVPRVDVDYEEETKDLSKKKTFQEFVTDDNFLKEADLYMQSRFGKDDGRQADESDKEFTKRFIEHYRHVNGNTLDLMSQVDWTRGASNADKARYGALFRDMERLPDFYEEGGTGTFDALMDYGEGLLTDPLTYFGFGAGAVAKFGATKAAKKLILDNVAKGMTKEAATEAAKKQSLKIGLKASAKPLAVETAVASGEGAYAASAGAELDAEAGIREAYGLEDKASAEEIAITGGITGALTLGLGAFAVPAIGKLGMFDAKRNIDLQQTVKEGLDKKLRAKAQKGNVTKEQLDEFDPINESKILDDIRNIDESVAKRKEDLKKGRETIEKLDPATDITEANLSAEIQEKVAKISIDVVKQMSGSNDKVVRAFFEDLKSGYASRKDKTMNLTMMMIKKLDDLKTGGIAIEDFDRIIARSGLSAEEFANAYGATRSKVGSDLRKDSDFGKMMRELVDFDPKLKQEFDKKFGKIDPTTNMLSKAHDIMMRLDRERRALMVTQLSTTMRNVATGAMRLTMEAGSNLVESSVYNIGRGLNSALKGEISAKGVQKGFTDIFRDTFGTLGNVVGTGLGGIRTTEVAENLLRYNPMLLRQLDRSLQEVGADQSLSAFTRFLNKANMAQDIVFRKAVFTANIDKQLRRMGTNALEVAVSGKTLPTEMLKNAMEESLYFTFARMPKAGTGDKPLDTLGSHFVKINEALGPLPGLVGIPAGTSAFPYTRFMVNAMQFNLQYQPGSVLAAFWNAGAGWNNLRKGKLDANFKELGEKQIAKARDQLGRGIVGSAALLAAYKYRKESQDTNWYEMKSDDGRTVDIRPFFPLAPYMIVGDLWAKYQEGTLRSGEVMGNLFEGVTGTMMRAGASEYVTENLFFALGGVEDFNSRDGERTGEIVAGYIGELVGGAFTPARVLKDIEAAFSKEAAIIRDSKQIEGIGIERPMKTLQNSIQRNLPFVSKYLPEKQFATRSGPVYEQSSIGKQLTGRRFTPKKNTIEEELVRFGMEEFELLTPTGDKTADSYVKKFLGKLAEENLTREINSDYYQSLSDKKREASFANKLKYYRKIAKEMGEDLATSEANQKGKSITPFDRAKYNKLTKRQRRLADEYYMEQYGRSVLAMQQEEPNINHFLNAVFIGRELSQAFQ